MTDKRNIGVRHISDARENRSRTLKFGQKKMKTKPRMIGPKQSQSPSYHNSYNRHKDFTTPKRRPRTRLNGCYSGDSPNETESPQDIIWDTNSPTENLNGQRNGRVIEISEIVNRIAPNVEKAKDGDSVLQWIGDSAIPCTPEVRQPRVRRISARQSNVEDLMKLAKQFDINMTRQDKEKQESTERKNKLNEVQSGGTTYTKRTTPIPVVSEKSCSSQSRQEEAELQALFDGPTQYVSGRLSPPSVNCTPENTSDPVAQDGPRSSSSAVRITHKNAVAQVAPKSSFAEVTKTPLNPSEPAAQAGPRSSSSAIKITPQNIIEPAAQAGPKSSSAVMTIASADAPKPTAFDDDWENDDLLNDSFVLEMTQNPVPLNVAQKQSAAQPVSFSKKSNFVTKVSPSVSNVRNICSETQQRPNKNSTFTKTLSVVKTSNQSTFKLKSPAAAQNLTTEKLLKTSPLNRVNQQTHSPQGTQQAELGGMTKDCGVSSQDSSAQFKGVSEDDIKSLFDSDGLWNDEDDDLLYKACDDVEKLSASQELQKRAEKGNKLAHDKSKTTVLKAPSLCETTDLNGKSQPQEATKSTHVFARSNSVPCTSGSSAFKQGHSALQTTKSSSSGLGNQSAQCRQAQKTSQEKSALGSRPGSDRTTDTSQTGGNASNPHNCTLKRHLSDSITLTNKVFISSHVTAKCSAAEIEKKKQEAIARRRLRMQASQKNGAPT